MKFYFQNTNIHFRHRT